MPQITILVVDDEKEIAVQLNGKMKATVLLSVTADREEALAKAKEAVADKIAGAQIVKEIYVPGKIINIVIRK